MTSDVMSLPLVEWDAYAGVVYLRLAERPELVTSAELEGGNVMVDRNYYGDEIVGVELLAEPHGDDSLILPAHVWVLATKAWLRAESSLRANRGDKVTGRFTLAHSGEAS